MGARTFSGWAASASNRRHPGLKPGALPTELAAHGQGAPMVPSPCPCCQRDCRTLATAAARSCVRARLALRPGLIGRQQLVADASNRGDHRFVLGAQLGSEPADVDVDRAGAAEEVVAPHFLQELGPGRYPTRPGGKEAQQLEFLVGQVEWPRAQADLVRDG